MKPVQHSWNLPVKTIESLERYFLKCWEKWYFLENIKQCCGEDYIVMEDETWYKVIWLDEVKDLKETVGLSFRKIDDNNAWVIVKNWSK